MTSKGERTRNVSPDMMKELGESGAFYPFVEFAREKEKDLALCFRGNDSKIGKVIIYRHNHVIWELSISRGKPKVSVSMNHARFMYNWIDYAIKGLMDLGFRSPDNKSFDTIKNENGFAVRHKSKNKYTYSAINLCFFPRLSEKPVKEVIEKSYEILTNMQDVYFYNDSKEFLKYYAQSEKDRGEQRPINCIKEYYFDKHPNASKDDDNHDFFAKFQKCLEKHVQQDLFINNHKIGKGVFIYDLEFEQPKVDGVTITDKNKPDMLGIRFDSKGNMVAICMIEVKSTKGALEEKSGLINHRDGMERYLQMSSSEGPLMDDRKREACRILNDYNELGLYGVPQKYNEEDFLKLDSEIIFVLGVRTFF